MEYTEQQIERLTELQLTVNDGRGISCVKDILSYLRRGGFREAETIRQTDGDKTASYRVLEGYLNEMMGCRTHLQKNCRNPLCVKLENYRKESIKKLS